MRIGRRKEESSSLEPGEGLSPVENHVVEGDAEIRAGLQGFGHLDVDGNLLPAALPLSLQADLWQGQRGFSHPKQGYPRTPKLGETPHPLPWGSGWAGRGWSHQRPKRPRSQRAAPSAWQSGYSCTPPRGWGAHRGFSPSSARPTPRSAPQKPSLKVKTQSSWSRWGRSTSVDKQQGSAWGQCPEALGDPGGAVGVPGPPLSPEAHVVLIDSFVLAVNPHKVQPHGDRGSFHRRLRPLRPVRDRGVSTDPAAAPGPQNVGLGSALTAWQQLGGSPGWARGSGRAGGWVGSGQARRLFQAGWAARPLCFSTGSCRGLG